MMKGKRLIVFLVAVSMMLVSMFSGLPVSAAAETEADTVFAEAELMGKKTCTIKKKKSRYYYVNAKGRTTKKKGWQKNAGGDYTYFVGSKGYVTAKITNGNYYKWKSGRFVRTSLSKYKGKTVKLKGNTFYVKKNGKISKTKGWQKNAGGDYAYYIGEKGNVTAKITKGKYYKSKSGGFVLAALSGRATTAKLNNRYFYVNTNGKIVTSTGWKKNASGAYAYYVSANGSVTAKLSGGGYFRYASGKFTKKSLAAYKGQTIKIHGLSVIVSEDGTASVVEKTHAANDNDNSGDNNNNQPEEHVHQWQKAYDEDLFPIESNYTEHPEEYHYEKVITVPAWDEPVYEERYVCLNCVWSTQPKEGETWEDVNGDGKWTASDEGRVYYTEYSFETAGELSAHFDSCYGHGQSTVADVIVSYIHHDDVWGEEKVVDKEAWSEWDETCKCTVCGETMSEHVVSGNLAGSLSGTCAWIPSKSGDMLYFDGSGVCRVVTANVPYGNDGYLTLLKEHGFIK